MDDDKLLANNGGCAISGSKFLTHIVNKLKMSSKSDKIDSIGFKNNKSCLYSFQDKHIRFFVKKSSKELP